MRFVTILKQSENKIQWDLLPWCEVEEVVKVFQFGNTKYEKNDWMKVENKRDKYFAAALRHIIAWWNGESKDSESGLNHLAHAICCLLILMWNKNI